MNSAKKHTKNIKIQTYLSSVIVVTARYSIQYRFVYSDEQIYSTNHRWLPCYPTNEEGHRMASCGAFVDARTQAIVEFVLHTGMDVGVFGPNGVEEEINWEEVS